MTDAQDRQASALFRYGLIADFIHLPAGSPGLYARLREKAAADYTIPGSKRVRVAPETLRHWLKDYRRGGFDALLPKGRSDRGHSRVLSQTAAEALVSLKEEQPHLSTAQLISVAGQRGVVPDSLKLAPRPCTGCSAGPGCWRRPRQMVPGRTGAASPSRSPASYG